MRAGSARGVQVALELAVRFSRRFSCRPYYVVMWPKAKAPPRYPHGASLEYFLMTPHAMQRARACSVVESVGTSSRRFGGLVKQQEQPHLVAVWRRMGRGDGAWTVRSGDGAGSERARARAVSS